MTRRRASSLIAALLLAGAGCGRQPPPADRFTASGQLVALSGGDAGAANACFTCHGLDGRGNGAGVPRLAGLDVGYLNRQLDDYADGRRQHPEMQAIAVRLGRRDRQAVAAYYAGMPYEPRPAARATPSMLYVGGDPDRGLLPCATCHGVRGEGVGPGNPPLAGQPAAYLAEQLRKWQRSERRGDPGNIMLAISRRLTAREVESVAAHASALPGAPRRGSPAASLEARRGDPRNDASAPRRRGAE